MSRNPRYDAYIRSPAWRYKRIAFLSSRPVLRCARCGSFNGPFEVHHKTYARLGHEDFADLECLCRGCHKAVHGRGKRLRLLGLLSRAVNLRLGRVR